MYRSTTPELIFNINNTGFDMSAIEICHITVESDFTSHKIIYEQPEIDIEHKQIRQVMSQSETKAFTPGKVKIQLKVKMDNGSVICSPIILKDMNEILEDDEL